MRIRLGTTPMYGPDYRDYLDLVFVVLDSNFHKPDSVSSAACAIAKKTGLEGVRLHALRHTHTSALLHAGVPITKVANG